MTFRSIKFHESEVMRELERQAVREGHFDLTPEEHVKLAVEEVKQTPSAQPTGDLFADICALAAGLERKGYKKQAAELMEKLGLFKEAETHLYHAIEETPEMLLEMAHSEGDVTVVPSEGDLGVVETLKSTQEKLRRIVEKQPGGKQAEAAVKTAQFRGIQEVAKETNKALYDFSVARKQKPVDVKNFTFKDANLRDGRAMRSYSRITGVSVGSIMNWVRVSDISASLGFGAIPTQESILNVMISDQAGGNFKAVNSLADAVGFNVNPYYQGVFNEEVTSDRGAPVAIVSRRWNVNPQSMFEEKALPNALVALNFSRINQDKARQVARLLSEAIRRNAYNPVFGVNDSKLMMANNTLSSLISGIYKSIDSVKTSVNVTSPQEAIGFISDAATVVESQKEKLTRDPLIVPQESDYQAVLQWLERLESIVRKGYGGAARSDQMRPYKANLSDLNKARIYWQSKLNERGIDPKLKNKIETEILANINNIGSILSKYEKEPRPWVEVKEALSRAGIQMPNAATLDGQLSELGKIRLPGDTTEEGPNG